MKADEQDGEDAEEELGRHGKEGQLRDQPGQALPS
jgi:hypothetical protein